MSTEPSQRLAQLFEEVSCLDGPARAEFLARLRAEDAETATTLEELLHWDATDSGIRLDSKPFRVNASRAVSRAPASGARDELLARLARHEAPASRYEIEEEVARGGMGAVLRVRDTDLERDLAMKVVLGPESAGPAGTSSVNLARLLEEARVQGRMNHPGVVPVYELGHHPERGVYFTMRLVRGQNLGEVFQLVREGREGWTQVRAIHVLLRVCETMSYAHSKGVIHRDLKPSNIMVGRFGQVYVMDWGIAKVLGAEDPHDVRLRSTSGADGARDREAREGTSTHDPLETMDGHIVGTPSYMPLEQAQGRLESLGPHSDVYSVGAMLYELVAGRAPYDTPGRPVPPRAILARLLTSNPEPVHAIAPEVPPELEAICEKAMARDGAQRYPDTSAMGEDLLAYLEDRVVRAHRTGAVVELQKWIRRNRGLATAVGVAVLALAVGLVVSLFLMAQAESQRHIASKERDNVLRLRALQDLQGLIDEAASDAMWPPHPERGPLYRDWLARSENLVAGLHPSADSVGHYTLLDQVRARVEHPSADVGSEALESEAWWLDQLEKLVGGIEAFADERTGLAGAGVSPGDGWGVRRRLAFAESVAERSLTGPEAARLWREAADYVRNSSRYGGLELEPQLGLLPLGPDPDSGLLELAHLASGDVVARDARGRLAPTETSGVVLVLLPAGLFHMGAQDDPGGTNHSAIVEHDEGPVHEVSLAPFLLAKYELTQGQWLAFTGENPAAYHTGTQFAGRQHDLRHPVESVRWHEAVATLARMDLALPTEAQWEYAARGGTASTWWFGEDETECRTSANVADAYSQANGGPSGLTYEAWSDGFTAHAPVGSFRPNPFGLHDVCGNVWEWCRDHYKPYTYEVSANDGERLGPPTPLRTARGGAFTFTAEQARSANRYGLEPDLPQFNVGLRPARRLDP